MKMGIVQNKVWFLLDDEELLPYEVTLDQFRERNPFKENIILELVKKHTMNMVRNIDLKGQICRYYTSFRWQTS